jgi:hypothetical protein
MVHMCVMVCTLFDWSPHFMTFVNVAFLFVLFNVCHYRV